MTQPGLVFPNITLTIGSIHGSLCNFDLWPLQIFHEFQMWYSWFIYLNNQGHVSPYWYLRATMTSKKIRQRRKKVSIKWKPNGKRPRFKDFMHTFNWESAACVTCMYKCNRYNFSGLFGNIRTISSFTVFWKTQEVAVGQFTGNYRLSFGSTLLSLYKSLIKETQSKKKKIQKNNINLLLHRTNAMVK